MKAAEITDAKTNYIVQALDNYKALIIDATGRGFWMNPHKELLSKALSQLESLSAKADAAEKLCCSDELFDDSIGCANCFLLEICMLRAGGGQG
jgi:hypothetical protein